MKVIVNGEERVLQFNSTLRDLTTLLFQEEPKGVALAVNEEVIPREAWGAYALKEGDAVTVVVATQGG